MAKVAFNMRMDEELKRRIDEFSSASGLSRSRIVSRAVTRYLDDIERVARVSHRDVGPVRVGSQYVE